jgi:hypothetical protein
MVFNTVGGGHLAVTTAIDRAGGAFVAATGQRAARITIKPVRTYAAEAIRPSFSCIGIRVDVRVDVRVRVRTGVSIGVGIRVGAGVHPRPRISDLCPTGAAAAHAREEQEDDAPWNVASCNQDAPPHSQAGWFSKQPVSTVPPCPLHTGSQAASKSEKDPQSTSVHRSGLSS